MACVGELFIGDTGTSIEVLVKECNDKLDPPVEELVDISDATGLQIKFIKPDGSALIKTEPDVKLLTDGTDSLFHYLTLQSDLDQSGNWKAQGKVTMPSGTWYTSTFKFKVNDVL